mgnify:FL=1
MNRIDKLFNNKKNGILSIYFTAGYPSKDSVLPMIKALSNNGVDMIELGMPFSDPMADGPVIQAASTHAIKNGMGLPLLLETLQDLRKITEIPVLLMGYLNPVLHYGMDKFIAKCQEIGIDGIILPDLPMAEYQLRYKEKFEKANLHNIFLISPQTSDERIHEIDNNSSGFIYMVSSSSITGRKAGMNDAQLEYFNRIKKLNLKNPRMIGFGISDHKTFQTACQYASGAIIGTAYVKSVTNPTTIEQDTKSFIENIL